MERCRRPNNDPLIPGVCEYVKLCGERDFAEGIKVMNLKIEIILDYLGRPPSSNMIP